MGTHHRIAIISLVAFAPLTYRLSDAAIILPVDGSVTLGAPRADGSVDVFVDFGITFDPTQVDRGSYTQEFTINLGPDGFDADDAFGIFFPTGGGTVLEFGADRDLLLSNPSPELVFGNAGLTPGMHVQLQDGVAEYELVPFTTTGGDLSTRVRAPVIDILSVSVRLIEQPHLPPPPPPPPPPPTPIPEPSSCIVWAMSCLAFSSVRSRRQRS